MQKALRTVFLGWLAFLAVPAQATFHLWQITEVFSNADGSVQFIELRALAAGQQFISGHQLKSIQGNQTRTFTFPSNLPGDTAVTEDGGGYGGGEAVAFKSMLIGTQGFAALGVVTPDYIVPNGFLFSSNGTVNFSDADVLSYASLPSDGLLSLYRGGGTATNSPRNFAGATGTVSTIDYSGAWYNANESGWGLSIIRGASGAYGIIMYNFNTSRVPTWYFMAGGTFSGNTYVGPINFYTGTPFSDPFNASQLVVAPVGNVSITFFSATTGSINYTLNGNTVTRSISKIAF